jgi:alkylated DNA nucleotide flippase Atl1
LKFSSGSLVRLGADAAVRITFECEPCGRLNKFRPALSKDIVGKRGYLARVVRSGSVRPGDKVQVEKDVFDPFSDNWRDRVTDVVQKLPADCVLSYSQLAELAGVPKVFCRVFPRLLRSHGDLPWQRVVPSNQLKMSPNTPGEQAWVGGVIFRGETPSFVKEYYNG